ncbi:MAG TPA: hypothetical protein VMM18_16040 [Gemmatimonadaceae bacterium]|nr:hypothetical protein [Gemmatimonadaceae bacterium]
MLHLSIERLAALAAEEPSAAESEHLAACLECARERAAHAGIVRMAADERAHLAPPLTSWESIAARLREEKLIAPAARRRPASVRGWIRAAAAVLLVAGGIAIGRASTGETVIAGLGASPDGSAGVQAFTFESDSAALAALESAERSVKGALEYLATRDEADFPARYEAMRARLAALDEVATTTSRALAHQPLDPVLNSYHLSTLGYREATLRQLDASLPEGVRLTSW